MKTLAEGRGIHSHPPINVPRGPMSDWRYTGVCLSKAIMTRDNLSCGKQYKL